MRLLSNDSLDSLTSSLSNRTVDGTDGDTDGSLGVELEVGEERDGGGLALGHGGGGEDTSSVGLVVVIGGILDGSETNVLKEVSNTLGVVLLLEFVDELGLLLRVVVGLPLLLKELSITVLIRNAEGKNDNRKRNRKSVAGTVAGEGDVQDRSRSEGLLAVEGEHLLGLALDVDGVVHFTLVDLKTSLLVLDGSGELLKLRVSLVGVEDSELGLGTVQLLLNTNLNVAILIKDRLVAGETLGVPHGHLLLSLFIETLGLTLLFVFLFILVFFFLILFFFFAVLLIVIVIIIIIIVIIIIIIIIFILRALDLLIVGVELGLKDILVVLTEGRHGLNDIKEEIALAQGVVLDGTLLDFSIEMSQSVLEDAVDFVLEVLKDSEELDEGGDHESLSSKSDLVVVLLKDFEDVEAGDGLFVLLVLFLRNDEFSVLTENVGGELDDKLMDVRGLEGLVHLLSGVLLEILLLGDDLDASVPDIIRDVVTSAGDEVEDGIDVPVVVGGITLGKNGDLEGHFLLDHEIRSLQVSKKSGDDLLGVLLVAHGEEHLKSTLTNGDILIVEGGEDALLVSLDLVADVIEEGKAGHGLETEITDVGLLGVDVAAEGIDDGGSELVVGVIAVGDDDVDDLEEDGVGGVDLAGAAGNLSLGEDGAADVLEDADLSLGLRVGDVLEHAEAVDDQPGAADGVVDVGGGALLVEDEGLEDLDANGADVLVALGGVGDDGGDEAGGGDTDAEVVVLQEADDAGDPIGTDDIGAGAVEGKEGEDGLLSDDGGGALVVDELEDIIEDGFGEISAAEVGAGGEGEALVVLDSTDDIVSDGVDDKGEEFIGVLEEDGGSHVTDLLLLEGRSGDQGDDLHVAEVDLVAEKDATGVREEKERRTCRRASRRTSYDRRQRCSSWRSSV